MNASQKDNKAQCLNYKRQIEFLFFQTNKEDFLKRILPTAPPTLSEYVKPKVEEAVNSWQVKGEFESTAKWQERVNENTRKAKAQELAAQYTKEYQAWVDKYNRSYEEACKRFYAMKELQKKAEFNADALTLSRYDADNESFMVSGASADILLPVPVDDAPAFKQNWTTIRQTADLKYVPNGDDVALVSVSFTSNGKTYTYDGSSDVKYAITDVDYNFRPLEVALDNSNIDFAFNPLESSEQTMASTSPKGIDGKKGKVEHKTIQATSVADVDTNIPTGEKGNDKTFAVIVGNENYQKVANVTYALNDAKVFEAYSQKVLGLPQKNIRFYADATFANMLSAVDDIESIAKAYKGDLNIIFYYAGHGVPNESSNEAYLLPVDADGRNTEVCYPLARLYRELGAMPSRSTVVFMDACFSGSERSGQMLASARGIAIKAKQATPTGKMVVFSAAQGDETAYPYKEQGHGLFTYFLLKKLQESKGNCTLGDLGEYILKEVSRKSIVENGKPQTPTVVPATGMSDDWKNWKLR